MRSGSFKSLYRGRGIDFSGVREYVPGDDVRAIDWNVSSRMNKTFVKVFEEERELDVLIVADASLSMETGGAARFPFRARRGRSAEGRGGCAARTKLEAAAECAMLICLACFYNAHPVGAVIFSGALDFSSTPKTGQANCFFLLSKFERMSSSGEGSALDRALRGAAGALKKRSLVFVISDFRSASYFDSFARLCEKNDVIAVRITDSSDGELPDVGTVSFRDPETGQRAALPTHSGRFARTRRRENDGRNAAWAAECARRGGAPLFIDTNDDAAKSLITFFSGRERYGT